MWIFYTASKGNSVLEDNTRAGGGEWNAKSQQVDGWTVEWRSINCSSQRVPRWLIPFCRCNKRAQNTDGWIINSSYHFLTDIFFLVLKRALRQFASLSQKNLIFSLSCDLLLFSFFVCSSSGTWWSGIIRSTSPSLSLWKRTQPSRSTGAGSVSSTARTARGCSTSATLWTSDLAERQEGRAAEKMSGQGWR